MALDKNTGSTITQDEAIRYVGAFKAKYPDELKCFFAGSNNLNLILQQPDCIGIRIYNGIDETTGKMNQVLVGVDSFEKDMLNGVILDRLSFCPPACDVSSPLQQ